MFRRNKRRRSIIDELFGGSLFDEFDELFERFESEGSESGYSIRVTQTPEGTKVYAKVGKNVDVGELKRRLQSEYPNAEIVIEGGKPLIREISTKDAEVEKDNKGKDEDVIRLG
ncbi:hypothetical protein DRO55_00315 [Candidatus Bathyarchaeota archaeon]|nr:MAG: hypothetical protein DRO55_00315 [Candidatus Bathyarchaeota archaeon]